ncbi:E3 ubiquitin-protein ligase bre1 [Neolecta irregularis DAH-3]|uniref:E3 ubiquitin-protein ligase bre1 n=1 Tax=Neolecta irregularis (strain DAH-3) TaxID=1198029 RepID=A0A1U7LR22_NEOID|nr:E3 ubiquitin-protein ligase bre1 [Neolecta irregularis DAH-3]|eukprot:OLL25107.1 E3 ubiquitin-protein ligase bre1 [Neolecta irregularis DAH-3]
MEERKRRLESSDECPPAKRSHFQLVQQEVEAFQREALWRALQESRRQHSQLFDELQTVRKTYAHYDSAMREMDVWWAQLAEEMGSLGGNQREAGIGQGVNQRDGTSQKDAGVNQRDAGINHKDAGVNHKDAGVNYKDAGVNYKDASVNYKDASGHSLHSLFADPTRFRCLLEAKRESTLAILTAAVPRLDAAIAALPPQTQSLLDKIRALSLDTKQLRHQLERAAVEKDEKDSRIAQLTYNLKAVHRAVDRGKSLTLKRILKQEEPAEPADREPAKPSPDSLADSQKLVQLTALHETQSQQLADITDRYAKLLLQLERLKSEASIFCAGC